MNKFDFIGDIHGHIDKLKMLLNKMGYDDDRGYFSHPSRKAFFIGDYIDRGPDNPGVVKLVRQMVENDAAIALMGNHEYNAVLFNILGKEGYLRPHTLKNIKQHSATLLQYNGKQNQYEDDINWFRTLPLFYEGEDFKACHASWNHAAIERIKRHTEKGVLTEQLFIESAKKDSALFKDVETVCKGLEAHLPKGTSFFDKDGTERFDIRLKWWENPLEKTVKDMSVVNIEMEAQAFEGKFTHYDRNEDPVFFGHYWLSGKPELLKSNICCLDYSVAKDGYIVAYRFNGEKVLTNENLVFL